MFAGALLFSAASVASPYPVQEVLTAFGEVCFDPTTVTRDGAKKAALWKDLARSRDWIEIAKIPEPAASRGRNAPVRTYYWAKALNYELYSALANFKEQTIDEALFRRRIGGRDVYLSIFETGSDVSGLAECRLRDPLGDGIRKSPITEAAIEAWLGRSVSKSRGWYHGAEYSWPNGGGQLSVRVHFGFDQRRLGVSAAYDPYALYGMTLVRSDHSYIIVT